MEDPQTESGSVPADGRSPYFVQSLERGLAVIRTFDEDHPRLTLTDVARRTGLTRAAARRFLLTLVDLGCVSYDARYFSLTPRVLELGYAYLSSQTLPELAQPHLEQLVAKVQESSSVSVLDGTDVVYVARVATSRIMRVTINVGTRFPAYATSMGRVLLAGLPDQKLEQLLRASDRQALTPRTATSLEVLKAAISQVRAAGYAIVDQELEEGLRSVAVPIRQSDGTVVAGVNISTHASRTTLKDMRNRLVPALLECAEAIETDLQYTQGRIVKSQM